MVFKDICILVLWTKVASALEGFNLQVILIPAVDAGEFLGNGRHLLRVWLEALENLLHDVGHHLPQAGPLYILWHLQYTTDTNMLTKTGKDDDVWCARIFRNFFRSISMFL